MVKLQAQSARQLSAALVTAAKCMSKRNSLAILDNILLRKHGNMLTFTTSTSEAQLTIPAPLTVVSGTMEESMCIPAGEVMSYISALPDCIVTLTFNDNKALDIDYCLAKGEQTKAGKASLAYLNANDFPILDGCNDPVSHLVLPGAYFTQVIKQASIFAADDELRPQMNGVYIDIASDSTCNIVATDGHKLIRCSYTQKGNQVQPSGIILSSIFIPSISAFSESESVTIDANSHTIRIYDKNTELICRTIEGCYPNYASVIPVNNPYSITFDKKEMLDSLKRVRIFGNITQLIKFEKDGAFIKISANNIDFATTSCEQVCIEKADCSEGFTIGLNAEFFANALNAIKEDIVRIQLSDATRAVIITADSNTPTILTLVMPMALDF